MSTIIICKACNKPILPDKEDKHERVVVRMINSYPIHYTLDCLYIYADKVSQKRLRVDTLNERHS